MKQSSGYLLTTISGVPYLLPYGQNIAEHRRGIQLNETGAFIWNCLKTEQTQNSLKKMLCGHFHITPENLPEMERDLNEFLARLTALGIVSDEVQSSFLTDRNVTGRTFKIGGLYLNISGPEQSLSKEFDPFEVSSCPQPDLSIEIQNSELPELPPQALLLRNRELYILEGTDDYLLLFPMAKQLAGIHLDKDGSRARCYCRPPYDRQTVADLFHAIRLVYLYCAQKKNIFALHSASILYDGKAWLFSGPSGTGKSTHTNLWKDFFHTPVINGDLNLIALEGEMPVIHGLPWCGTSGISDTKSYPLGGIILLRQAPFNRVDVLAEHEKTLLVMQRLISPSWTGELLEKNIEFIETLVPKIYTGRLNCTKEKEAAEVMKRSIDNKKPEVH